MIRSTSLLATLITVVAMSLLQIGCSDYSNGYGNCCRGRPTFGGLAAGAAPWGGFLWRHLRPGRRGGNHGYYHNGYGGSAAVDNGYGNATGRWGGTASWDKWSRRHARPPEGGPPIRAVGSGSATGYRGGTASWMAAPALTMGHTAVRAPGAAGSSVAESRSPAVHGGHRPPILNTLVSLRLHNLCDAFLARLFLAQNPAVHPQTLSPQF